MLYGIMRFFVRIFMNLRYSIRVYGKENIPRLQGGYIIAANHRCYADPPAIAAVIPARFSFMAKEELFHGNPLFAFVIRMCGAFPVKRGSDGGAVFKISLDKLRRGHKLVIFPEGTRSHDGRIARGRSGVAVIAEQSGVPVLPLALMYGLRSKNSIDVSIGPVLTPDMLGYREGQSRTNTAGAGEISGKEEIQLLHPEGAKRFRFITDDIINAIRNEQRNIFDLYSIDFDEFYSVRAEIADAAENAEKQQNNIT